MALRACLFALVTLVGAAKKGETDCTVTSVWPDGTELQRCAAAAPLQSRPQQALAVAQACASCIPPWHVPACTGSASSRVRAARRNVLRAPIPSRPRDASTNAPNANTTHARATGGAVKGVSKEFKWMKDTRWNWNNWRDVVFRADGSFLAPAEGCEREGNPQCQWSSDDEKVHSRPSPSLELEPDPSRSPDP